MKPELHPDAAKNFEEKAHVLLAAVRSEPLSEPSEPRPDIFRPGKPMMATFGPEDYTSFEITGKRNLLGQTQARYFEHEGRQFGLADEKYQALARLSENLQRTKTFRDLVSVRWVEDTLLDWMKDRFAGVTVPALGDYLSERCEGDVQENDLWFPVANLSVESDLPFGNVVFKTITSELMDKLVEDAQKAKEGRDPTYAAQLDMSMERRRADLQGLAAATSKLRAEPKRAYEIALRESERAVAALRVFDVTATTTPEVTSYCALLGRENVEGIKHLELEDGRIRSYSSQTVGKPVMNWHISDLDVSKYKKSLGFGEVSDLLSSSKRTEFQETLLNALLMYSRGAREKDFAGKIVYTLAAIENILLRNESEPIQQNVGERMAFINAKTAEERREILRTFKTVYGLRSKFVHHGHSVEERETVWQFLVQAWVLFTKLARWSTRLETKEKLIDHLEMMKLS